MNQQLLPPALENALNKKEPEIVFTEVLSALGEVLQADRCFLHLRNPQTRTYRQICWRRTQEIPEIATNGWEREREWEREDPMFAAALRTEASIFIEDIETASEKVIDREFERKYLKHRALIHAHLCQDNLLWGILQVSIFDRPRRWNEVDRQTIDLVIQRLTPIVHEVLSLKS